MPHDRLLDGIRVSCKLVADRRPDEVGATGIEALANQQIDMAEVDESDVDCDFLALTRPVSQSVYLSSHRCPSIPSRQTVYGCDVGGLQGDLDRLGGLIHSPRVPWR